MLLWHLGRSKWEQYDMANATVVMRILVLPKIGKLMISIKHLERVIEANLMLNV